MVAKNLHKIVGILMMLIIVSTTVSAITFEVYTKDYESEDPIASRIGVGNQDDKVWKNSGGRNDKASFHLSTNEVYLVEHTADGYKPDTDAVFFDSGLYDGCKNKNKGCSMQTRSFKTTCKPRTGYWLCKTVNTNNNAKSAFVYLGKVGGYYKVGRVNYLNKNYVPQISDIKVSGTNIKENPKNTFTFQETENIRLDVSASDQNGDSITYSLYNAPNGMTINSNGVITWNSDYDAVPGNDRSNTITITVNAGDYFTNGTQTIRLIVNKKNRAPTLTAPTIASGTYRKADTITCTAGTSADPDSDTLTSEWRWFIDGDRVNSATSQTFNCNDYSKCKKGEEVKCKQRVNDGSSNSNSDELNSGWKESNEITIANTAPQITGASITNPVLTEDKITCTPSGWDDIDVADVNNPIYSYTWLNNNQEISNQDSEELDCKQVSGCDKGDTITCEITPTDGTDEGDTKSDSVTIGNTIPEADNAQITPTNAYERSTLTGSADYSDADNDNSDNSNAYAWFIQNEGSGDFSLIANANSNTLTTANFDKNDIIVFQYTPNDGDDSGLSINSSPVTILNTAPNVTAVQITPTNPVYGNTLTGSGTFSDDDQEDSETNSRYAWFKQDEGSGDFSLISGETSTTLAPSNFDKDDVIIFQYTPNDGDDYGLPVNSSEITVGNTAPTISSVTISPDPAYTNTGLTMSGTFADVDDDSEAQSTFRWYNNGALINGETQNTLDQTNFVKDDSIIAEYTPYDGDDYGLPVNSSALTIGNTAPVLNPAPTIDDTTPTTDDIITCLAGTFTDIDTADSEQGTDYRWYENGKRIPSETSTTLDLSLRGLDKSDVIICSERTSDGTDVSEWTNSSNAATIQNSAPTVTAPTITTGTYYTNDTLTCNKGISITVIDILVNNPDKVEFLISTDTGWALTNIQDEGDTRSYTISGTDYNITVDDIDSNQATFTINGVTTNALSIDESETVFNGAIGNDIDEDSLTVTYKWYSDNTEIFTGQDLDCGTTTNCDKHDNITCSVQVMDDEGLTSTEEFSNIIEIQNSIPKIDYINVTDYARTDYTITCTPIGWYDEDGDAPQYLITWLGNQTAFTGQTSQTLDCDTVSGCDKNIVVTCEVYPDDGEDLGARHIDTVTISNTPPVLNPAPTIDNIIPFTNETITCQDGTFTDIDAPIDSEQATYYKWFENDVEISGQTLNTLDLNLVGLDKHDVIKCAEMTSDGDDNSSWTNSSNTATIQNSIPVWNPIPTNQSTLEDITLIYDVNATDLDLDTLYYFVNDTAFNMDINTGILTYTPPLNWNGDVDITITAGDDEVNISQDITTTVIPVDDTPIIDTFYPLTDPVINESFTQLFNISYYDIENDPLTTFWLIDGNQVATATDNHIFDANFTESGTYNVTAKVSDGNTNGSHEWTLTVMDVTGSITPELTASIELNPETPIENELTNINITIDNLGVTNAKDFTVEFLIDDVLNDTQVITLMAESQTSLQYNWNAVMGAHNFTIRLDTTNIIPEEWGGAEANNIVTKHLNVSQWTTIQGTVNGNIVLADFALNSMYNWTGAEGYVYGSDRDSTFNFNDLQALGINTTNAAATADFTEADTALSMVGFDKVSDLYSSSTTDSFVIFNRQVDNIPIYSNTGILWDTADDAGDNEYSGTEDLVFITRISNNNYEIKVPASLRSLVAGNDQVKLYSELQ